MPFRASDDERAAEILTTIGGRVRAERLARSRSQDWLARNAGLSQSTVSRLESGQAAGLRLELYARVLAAFRPFGADEDD